MYKVILIDDEKIIQKGLKGILDNFVNDVNVVAVAGNVAEGIAQIEKHNPDIVFLDIDMPDGTGFDLLKKLPQINFSLVFCTASNQHAIKAFKYNAIDYILKPLDIEDVVNAVEKAKNTLAIKEKNVSIDQLLSFMQDSQKVKDKLVLKTMSDMFIVQINDIYNCQSDGGYTTFMFKDDNSIVVSNTLKTYESILLQHNFIKTHRSHLVNTEYIKQIHKMDGGFIVLDNDRKIPISSRKRNTVIEAISKLL